MFTAGVLFFIFIDDVPLWLLALAMICDTALMIAGVEKL